MSVSPFRCKLWEHHDRLEEHVTEESCKHEIESFMAQGQMVPALGRRLRGNADFDVELIYGARRLFVARHLNMPLLVEVRELSDEDAAIAMDIENRQRADISPYERGLSYSRWLRLALFDSQSAIARKLKISESQVSKLLKLARLPAVIINAFSTPLEIREEWGSALADLLADPTTRQATIRMARTIASKTCRPSSREVFRQLLGASVQGKKIRSQSHDQVVHDDAGRPLFRIKQGNKAIALMLPVTVVSSALLDDIRLAVRDILKARPPTTPATFTRAEIGDSAQAGIWQASAVSPPAISGSS